jgi:hypothetical protein
MELVKEVMMGRKNTADGEIKYVYRILTVNRLGQRRRGRIMSRRILRQQVMRTGSE